MFLTQKNILRVLSLDFCNWIYSFWCVRDRTHAVQCCMWKFGSWIFILDLGWTFRIYSLWGGLTWCCGSHCGSHSGSHSSVYCDEFEWRWLVWPHGFYPVFRREDCFCTGERERYCMIVCERECVRMCLCVCWLVCESLWVWERESTSTPFVHKIKINKNK